jgi:outer membrane immunogenic protein
LLLGHSLPCLRWAPIFQQRLRSTKAPIAPIANNWTGFYLGGSVGGRWANSEWTTTCLQPGYRGIDGCPNNYPVLIANDNPATFDSASFRGGIYGGYNWQVAPLWIVGIEGDVAWAKNNKNHAGIPGGWTPTGPGSPGLDSSNVKETWDAGIRGRLGFLINPSVLLFAAGGASWSKLEASAHCGSPWTVGYCLGGGPFIGTTETISKTMTGWTVGGGIEWMLTSHWLVRGEYRYTQYGTLSGTFFPGFNGANLNGDALSASVNLNTHTALLGAAYKFQ